MLQIALFCLATIPPAPAQVVLDARDNEHHIVHVQITLPPGGEGLRQLSLPTWIPGSYKIRDFATHVEGFEVSFDGKPLPWKKADKSTWEINAPSGAELTVNYRVFANDLSVRTSYLSGDFGILSPASLIMYEPTRRGQPLQLNITLPAGWTIETAMDRIADRGFRAATYDQLIDTPLLVGNLRTYDFQVNGLAHRWVIAGEVFGDTDAMVKDMQRVAETVEAFFGWSPFQNYTVLSYFTPHGHQSGLEFSNSALLQVDRAQLLSEKGWRSFLALFCHEYIHAWNVKAMRDPVLLKPDLQREAYTDLLWLHEGWTSYYDQLLLVRAGVWTQDQLLEAWSRTIAQYRRTPGRHSESLAAASFDAWIHLYVKRAESPNAEISYYRVGELSGLAMDLFIRQKTRGKLSLDDLMRDLINNARTQGNTVTWDDINGWMEREVGKEALAFIDRHILSATPIPLETYLAYAGLMIAHKAVEEREPTTGFRPTDAQEIPGLGVQQRDGAYYVTSIQKGSGAWDSGLDYGDEILAIDGLRVSRGNLSEILLSRAPADTVTLLVARSGQLTELTVAIDDEPGQLLITDIENASDQQRGLRQAWLGEPEPTARNKETTHDGND